MTKDKRYKTVCHLISDGHIKTLIEIFDTIPKSVVAKDLGISLDRFSKMINDVERFNVRKLFQMAQLIEIDELEILKLIYQQHSVERKAKRRSKG